MSTSLIQTKPQEGFKYLLFSSSLFFSTLAELSQVNADWHYRKDHWPNLSDHGRVEIQVSEISINLDLRIGT